MRREGAGRKTPACGAEGEQSDGRASCPDSSEDERHLGGNAVFPETVDVNIRQLDPIPAPRYFLRELPLTDDMSDLVLQSRQEIRDILHGRDDRLLVIVGPCSIHDPKAAHEYAQRLAALKGELEDRLMIVMRVYFEKPRTTIGWKGLINDPDLDGRFDIRKGMWLARKVLTDVLGLGLRRRPNGWIRLHRSTSAI